MLLLEFYSLIRIVLILVIARNNVWFLRFIYLFFCPNKSEMATLDQNNLTQKQEGSRR